MLTRCLFDRPLSRNGSRPAQPTRVGNFSNKSAITTRLGVAVPKLASIFSGHRFRVGAKHVNHMLLEKVLILVKAFESTMRWGLPLPAFSISGCKASPILSPIRPPSWAICSSVKKIRINAMLVFDRRNDNFHSGLLPGDLLLGLFLGTLQKNGRCS